MFEQRITVRLMKFWDMLRKDRPMPPVGKLNIAMIEDIWPLCFRVAVDSHGKSPIYTYDYMGEPIVEMYGRDLRGTVVDKRTTQFPGAVIHKRFDEILGGGQPVVDDGHFTNEQGRLIKYRACIVPFGDEKHGVTHLLIGLSCRYF